MKTLFFLLLLTPICSQAYTSKDCVQIYYDRGPEDYWMGRTYSIFLQNLLGHWPELQQITSPIELYKRGDLEACDYNIYIASYFENKIPVDFYEDFNSTKKNVAWLGYSIWKLGIDGLKKAFNAEYKGLTTLDSKNLDAKKHPSFYRFIEYRGETFFKYGDWDRNNPTSFLAPFEQVILSTTDPSQVLSWARHSFTGDRIPYIFHNKNKFYVADIPFSFAHEADRYFIFADLLFDILNKKPQHTKKYAFMRLEDVHSYVSLPYLYDFMYVAKNENIPYSISIIPIFFDPLNRYDRPPEDEFTTADRKIEFVEWLKEARLNKASFIWHGVTHQYYRIKNPHDGSSGSDFEFWDAINNSPVKEDSSEWVIDRLYDGIGILNKLNIIPKVWLTPHYQASPLDYLIFARLFDWNVGRVIYYNHMAENVPDLTNTGTYHLINSDKKKQADRLTAFADVKVNIEFNRWNGQMFPYEIYGDVYGQRLIPENLGNSQPFINAHVIRPRSVQEMVADAKRNLVLRDTWASFFYHPFLLESYESGGRGSYPGDTAELLYLIKEIKKLGYEFINLDDFVSKNTKPIRPEPIIKGIQ